MKKIVQGFLILTFLMLTSLPHGYSQEKVAPSKYMVWEVCVTPMQMDKLVKAIKTQHAFLKEQNYPYPGLVQYSNDGYFWYAVGFNDYAEIDKMNAYDEKLWKAHPEKSDEIRTLFKGAFSNVAGLVLHSKPKLSIVAEDNMTPPTGKTFRMFEKFYVKQGDMKEVIALVETYINLRKKHGFKDNFYTLLPAFAPNLSVIYFVDEVGDSAADHLMKNDEKWKNFGEEGQKLWNDVKPYVQRIETHFGFIDYDLSYFPPN